MSTVDTPLRSPSASGDAAAAAQTTATPTTATPTTATPTTATPTTATPTTGASTAAAPNTTPTTTTTTAPTTAKGRESLRSATRFVLAVCVAAGSALVLWQLWHGHLPTETDLPGYPLFFDFNPYPNFHAYYLIAVYFPAAAISVYWAVSRWGPLRVTARPPLRPVRVEFTNSVGTEQTPGRAPLFWVAARVSLPAAVVALEAGVVRQQASDPFGPFVVGVAVAYAAGVLAIAEALRFVRRRTTGARTGQAKPVARADAVARVNSVAAVLVLPMLYLVSRSTVVSVSATNGVDHHPWLPFWLVAIATSTWLGFSVRAFKDRGRTAAPREWEKNTLAWIVGPAFLYLATAQIYGMLGSFQVFEEGQGLAGSRLIAQGMFPWRDIQVTHGLIEDIFTPQLGLSVFENSRWGAEAGISLLVTPLTWLMLYAFVVYVSRRNLLFGLSFGVAVALGLIPAQWVRFALLPLILIVFDQVLRRRSKGFCGLLMVLLVVSSIIAPETGPMALLALLVLLAVEWARRDRRDDLTASFFRTLWCLGSGLVLAGMFALFLIGNNALGSFLDYYRLSAPGHGLESSIPRQWQLGDVRLDVMFAFPVVLALLTWWRAAFLVRLRRPWSSRDILMLLTALWVTFYFMKALYRLEYGHVWQVDAVAILLAILWVSWLIDHAGGLVAGLPRRVHRPVRLHPVAVGSVLVLVMVVVLAPDGLITTLRGIPQHFQAGSTAAALPGLSADLPGLGYTAPGTVDTVAIADLKTVLDRYSAPDDPVFDFTNAPGIVYYLLGRQPGTRFYHVSLAQPSYAQRELIGDLEASRPKLVVFHSTQFVGSDRDHVVNAVRHYDVSRYLLDKYKPLVNVSGELVMIRNDLAAGAPPLPRLRGPASTAGLLFDAGPCDWGYLPSRLKHPDLTQRPGVAVAADAVSTRAVTTSGWATDITSRGSTQVVAVESGRVLAVANPGKLRPDVAQSLASTAATTSGWSMTVMAHQGTELSFYALNKDGTASPLGLATGPPAKVLTLAGPQGVIDTADGVAHRVVANPSAGFVDSATDRRATAFRLPATTSLARYHWLELDSGQGFRPGSYSVTDESGDGTPAAEIRFSTLAGTGSRTYLPVGSCAAWRGLSPSHLLLLRSRTATPIVSARLVE